MLMFDLHLEAFDDRKFLPYRLPIEEYVVKKKKQYTYMDT